MGAPGDLVSRIPDAYLRRAAELALRAAGDTEPNPPVGCVIVDTAGVVVGEGWHERAGGPHAEVRALRMAGERARGATAYVTLEPCSHFGRTPPCSQALIDAGVARLVIGVRDGGVASGGGAETLRAAGVEVAFAADPAPFDEIVLAWRKRRSTGLPYVAVKQGTSIDGATSVDGQRRIGVTGSSGREVTYGLRARFGAVAVGANTVAVDDPSLLRRPGTLHPAIRVVIARDGVPPASSRIFQNEEAPTLLVASSDVLESIPVGALGGHVERVAYDPADGVEGALRAIADQGVASVLVEAGPSLFEALFAADLIDELITVVAGGLLGSALGGRQRISTVSGDSLEHPFVPSTSHVQGDVVVTHWLRRRERE